MIRAVFFDVDFTLIYPGQTFQAVGYHRFCADHGIVVDPTRFDAAIAAAASAFEGPQATTYTDEVWVSYTRRIIEGMGGDGEALERCARQIYGEWASNHHFELYDDTVASLAALSAAGLRIGLISNSHRCLVSFQEHFELQHLISAAVSSAAHGAMKPHPSIFQSAMRLVGTEPHESVMVGDSVAHDIDGALSAGMRAVFLRRGDQPHPREEALTASGVPVISSLHELRGALDDLAGR